MLVLLLLLLFLLLLLLEWFCLEQSEILIRIYIVSCAEEMNYVITLCSYAENAAIKELK